MPAGKPFGPGLRADVPETLGPAGIGVIPAIAWSGCSTGPCRRGSGRDEAKGRSGRDGTARTPTVGGAYVAGAITGPDTRAISWRTDHGGASNGSHATARTARNGTATPDDDHLLDIGGSQILQFRVWHRAA